MNRSIKIKTPAGAAYRNILCLALPIVIQNLFRAGGNTRFGLICDTIDMWLCAVPLGFFAAFVLKLPPMWVYFLICTDEFVKWPWVIRHYRSGKWLRNITREGV